MVALSFIGPSASNQSTFSSPSPAGDLGSAQRRDLSLKVLGGTEPVTRNRIRQFVLASVLIGHTYFRGVMETLEAVFDYRDISLSMIHNIVAQAVIDARAINNA